MKKLPFLLLPCFLAACMVGPDYHRPPVPVPETWANAPPNTQKPIWKEVKWWENYGDPILTQLVREALQANYTLKAAFARICQARATLLGAEAALEPRIDGIASYSRNQNSRNISQFSDQEGLLAPDTSGDVGGGGRFGRRRFDFYNVGFQTNWEIDLFGRLRRSIESAEASLEMQVDDMHNVLLSLIAEVALQYINLRGYQKQIEVTERSLKDWNSLYHLNEARLKAGLATELEVAQSKASRDQTEASLFPLKALVKTTIHQLSVLVGRPPACLYALLCPVKPIPQISAEIFAGLPSELLKRRPDIRAAERNLAASTAQIGVAEGELFPIFSFTGTFAFQSNKISNLFSGSSSFYSFGPSMILSLMDFGRVRAKINASLAMRDEALFEYKNTLLAALADVENALVNYTAEAKRYRVLIQAYEASKKATEISTLRYESGLINFLTVLQTNITSQEYELRLVQSLVTLASNTVALYKALGGGWEIDQTCWMEKQPPVIFPDLER